MNDNVLDELRKMYSDNPTAKVFFDFHANKKRARKEQAVKRVGRDMRLAGLNIQIADLIPVYQKLASLGLGTGKAGRGGRIIRFAWNPGINIRLLSALVKQPGAVVQRKLVGVKKPVATSQGVTRPYRITVENDRLVVSKNETKLDLPLDIEDDKLKKAMRLLDVI